MNLTASEQALVNYLLTLPPAGRERALDDACRETPGLSDRLHAILAVLPPPAGPLPPLSDQAVARGLQFALTASADEVPGLRLGGYKLLERIGEGGFGIVWMAEQLEPVRRRVAVKILKAGMDTEEVIARFESERQALALMDHPNIARVFDAGATETGRPFFVMELVRGIAITRYCDDHRLSAAARLRLFSSICQAVQHAHHKGVIHRDIKPSNILVTLHDGEPVPKIIDFGIAKATSARLTDRTLFTQFHTFLGTPAYTSPEQIEMSGLDVDTRSDVYSLGVLLYELLTGRPPFDSAALMQSGLEAMRRMVREVDPPRPSTRLDALAPEERTTLARQRGTDIAKLSLLLRGDLDWIIMRCLEKDRTRRYDTAAALAADVQRHLAHEPVAARPPTGAYRLRKFCRRHKAGVVAASAVTLSLVAGLVASTLLFARERTAHRRALTAEQTEGRLRQQAETARVQEVKSSARTALDLANRNLADGKTADGLAWLVYAARKDPFNRVLAPRLASVLASHVFLVPRAAPFACGSRVLALRFTRDGRSIFVGSADGTFRVLDAATGALVRQFQLGHEVVPGGWDFPVNNDAIFGVRFADNRFAVHDTATGRAKFPPLPLHPRLGLPDSNRTVSLSPQGRWLTAVAFGQTGSEPGHLWLWDAATGALQLHHTFTKNQGGWDFNPAEDTLALITGNTVERWTLPGGQPAAHPIWYRQKAITPSGAAEVRFSPDGLRLAVADINSVQVFEAATGKLERTMPPPDGRAITGFTAFATNDRLLGRSQNHSGWWDLADGRFQLLPVPSVSEVSLDAAGHRAVAFSRDGWLRVFDLDGGVIATAAWRQDGAYSMAISPDGAQILMGTSDGLVHRFGLTRDPARPLVLPRKPGPSGPTPFLPDPPNRLLVLATGGARVIDIPSGREIAGGFPFPQPTSLPIPQQPEPNFIVARIAGQSWQAWELDSTGVRHAVPLTGSDHETIGGLNFSPDGQRVALAGPAPPQVWDLHTGAAAGPPVNYPGLIVPFSISLNPDGSRLALGARDGAALVFDVATGGQLLSLPTRRQIRTWAVQFSPDGERILTTNQDGEFQLWHGLTGAPVGPGGRMIASIANPVFSPDSRWAAVRNTTATALLDARAGTVVGQPIPVGNIMVRFNRDSTRLAGAGLQNQVQVWDVPGGDLALEPLRHPGEVFLPEFSPDGRFLKVENRSLYVWSLPPALPSGTPTPDWLLELATLCAGVFVNEAGQLVPASADGVGRLRQQIATLPTDAPLAEWGRWVLDDRPERPIAPGFTIAPAEADQLAATPQ